jgi:hypothetical protein
MTDFAPLPFTENLKRWLREGERGTSSETIVSVATGVPISGDDLSPPLDPDDLRRCALLFCQVPELRPYLERMNKVAGWRRLVAQWDELVGLMWEESARNNGKCPFTYKRMQKALRQ